MTNRTAFRSFGILGKLSAVAAVLLTLGNLTGCGGFFSAITTTTTTNTGTGYDLIYVGKDNNASFAGYAVSSGGLTSIGSSYTLGAAPLSMAITPSNTYLYVGTTVGIYGYSIAAGGALTELNSNSVVANTPSGLKNGPVSMDISPDGDWLAVLTANTVGASTIYIYAIAPTTGLLTIQQSLTVPINNAAVNTAVAHTIKFSPNEDLIAVTLGTGGTDIFTFSAGTLTPAFSNYGNLTPPSSTDSNNSAIFSAAGTTLFIARGGSANSLDYYPINATTGAVNTTGYQYVTTGTNPSALAFNSPSASGQTYIYVTNAAITSSASTITGYPIATNSTTGVVTLGPSQLYGSPYSALGITPTAITVDNTDTYVLALSQTTGPPDLVEYTVDTTAATVGRLYVTGSVSTGLSTISGTYPGVVMVATHNGSGL
jgi:hypothetical protein